MKKILIIPGLLIMLTISGCFKDETPDPTPPIDPSIAAGINFSLFLKSNHSLWTVGYNGFGQLGTGNTNPVQEPTNITNDCIAIATGNRHSLFITNDNRLMAMGNNTYGQLGDGSSENRPAALFIDNNVVAISAGGFSSFYIKNDNSLWAIGRRNQPNKNRSRKSRRECEGRSNKRKPYAHREARQ